MGFRECYSGITIKPDYSIRLYYFLSGCSGYYFDGRHCRKSKEGVKSC